jgi:hypothetical protein
MVAALLRCDKDSLNRIGEQQGHDEGDRLSVDRPQYIKLGGTRESGVLIPMPDSPIDNRDLAEVGPESGNNYIPYFNHLLHAADFRTLKRTLAADDETLLSIGRIQDEVSVKVCMGRTGGFPHGLDDFA